MNFWEKMSQRPVFVWLWSFGGVWYGSYNIMKRLKEMNGAEGETRKKTNKVNDLGVVGVQNDAECS